MTSALPGVFLVASFVPMALWSAVESSRDPSLDDWSPAERALIASLSIDALGPPPPDPSNRFADHPAAASLGKKIFHDVRFSANGRVSCATCHRPDYGFTDDLPLAQGIGSMTRRSMPAVGMAYQRWFFWDGRKDTSWGQALEPVEQPVEHGISRTRTAQLVYEHYRDELETATGPLPSFDPTRYPAVARPDPSDGAALRAWRSIPSSDRDRITAVYVLTAKVVAAFVRTLTPSSSPFDRYARAVATGDESGLSSLTPKQTRGLRLFITGGKCINCHHGPLLSNGEFHHVGTPDAGAVDRGRAAVVATVAGGEFGCLGRWSDADPEKDCAHVRFLDASPAKYERAFKTPTLRDVASRPPYMHAGQFATLSEVLTHYRDLSGTKTVDETFHGELTDQELGQLEAFLESLTSRSAVRGTP